MPPSQPKKPAYQKSLIHVRNLQTTLPISTDAWGRPSKSQPLLISLSVTLFHPFSSAANQDAVEGSTVHYGVLSKAILAHCEAVREGKVRGHWVEGVRTLSRFAEELITSLFTGKNERTAATLDWDFVEAVELTLFLPKASLLGSGVKLVESIGSIILPRLFDRVPTAIGRINNAILQVCDLKVPCVIGVNPHEREAKQVVVANVGFEGEIDILGYQEQFWKFERAVVDAIEPSAFQTLEALTTHLLKAIIQNYLRPLSGNPFDIEPGMLKLRILLEKPTAVTFADAPGVEVVVDLSAENKQVREFWIMGA